MPSLVVCSRRTPFSGDELRFFCVCECLFRILQLALGLALIAYTTNQKNHVSKIDIQSLTCEEGGDFSAFASHAVSILYAQASVSICLAILGVGSAIPMLIISRKGTPTNSEPRKNLLVFCYFNISAMNMFRTAGFVLSIFSINVITQYCDCVAEEVDVGATERLKEACPQGSMWLGAMIALNVTLAIDVVVAIIVSIYFFVPRTSCPAIVPSESWWKAFFACCIGCSSSLTCCLFGGLEASFQGDFGDLALVMSNYTANNKTLDVTLSDIAAGLIMVVRQQREQLLEARERVLQSFYSNDDVLDDSSHKVSSHQRRFSDPDTSEREGQDQPPPRILKRLASTPESLGIIGESDPEGTEVSKKEVLSPENNQDKFFMAEAARFMPMAHATYTWLMFLYEYRLFGIVRLAYLILRRCACFCPSPKDKVLHDFPWEAHMIALEALSALATNDIVFASFKQSIAAVPYMIALDHEWKSVVIAIRGTLSMESILADIAIRPEELSTVGEQFGFDGHGRYCHRGMLKSSQWIYDDITKHGKLKEIMEGEYKNYRLRIIGHSLGAGCAAILSVMFRPSYPNLRCLAFSVPGCVFSENLAEESSSWLTSYVLDADIVPRLAIRPFEDLRDSVLKMICRIRVPKYQVFELPSSGTKDREELAEDNARILYGEDEVPDSQFKQQVDRFLKFQAELKEKNGPEEAYIDLYPPGKIIQLFLARSYKNSLFRLSSFPGIYKNQYPATRRKTEKNYVARWIHREDLQHIIVSSHLVADHEPTNVKRQIQKVAQTKFDLAPPLYKVFDEYSQA